MDCPDSCFRGIQKKEWLTGKRVSAEAFEFRNEPRENNDDNLELSICWKDNDNVLPNLLNQKKEDGSIHFEGGAVVLLRKELDMIKKRGYEGIFSYERRLIPGNDAHGNLLFSRNVDKKTKKVVMGHLACISEPLPA